ncbi:deoxyribodipyrimidine photo-lyase [Tothia fuscella]|uniref:Deoxyribodipyrimidine photo-lyase n=1 Tax=Tothia fuscella TaxID=1048955 RepID=A0A9P4P0G2_9PEZI|nr:deoxyribodipyrimidine photo-lyase [Tothia fuscella]
MAPKRKAPASVNYADSTGAKSNKRSATSTPHKDHAIIDAIISPVKSVLDFNHKRVEEEYGIVQREFYPPEMSNERCRMYNDNEIPRPIEVLEKMIADSQTARDSIRPGKAIMHWFKRDLRLYDNRALSMASKLAKMEGIPLICLFVVSPQDYQAHLTSPARVDFELRTLAVMKKDLEELDIPLLVVTQEKRKAIPKFILETCEKWGIKNIFANIEYEVDELRREAGMIQTCLEKDINFTVVHDDVVVAPGQLQTGTGRQYAVYSPWFRSWVSHVHSHSDLLSASEEPGANPGNPRKYLEDIFETPIPLAPENKKLSAEEKKRFEKLWPAGEHEALSRLQKFLDEKVGKYKDNRSIPHGSHTAMLSVHHSAGTLAARTSVRMVRDANSTQRLDGGNPGIMSWISEVAWRDFYKHVLAHWPYVCMSKPFKYEYTNVRWEYNDEQFKAWCKGMTGFPIVDAGMRQLNHMGYMHNRCRMITASFLAKDLLIDWRMGERYFMEHLIDGDFASNNGGWGFSASTGVDPQPYFRIFNPLLQSEKFDPNGDFIRKWVPELDAVEGKAIHDPYGRGAKEIAQKNGYPQPMVVHKDCRERALKRYKDGIGRETA